MELDRIDVDILKMLFEDSRRPLSQIGSELGLKTNQVKSRITQMEKEGVISSYSCLLNPTNMGLDLLSLFQIEAKNIDDQSSNLALTNNLLELLINQVPEILFGSVGEDPSINLPVIFALMFLRDQSHEENVLSKIQDNPLVDRVKSINLKSKNQAARLLRLKEAFQEVVLKDLD